MSVPGSRPLRLAATFLTVAAIAASFGPVHAADPTPPVDTQSGKVGAHSLVDTTGTPGGTCTYGRLVNGSIHNWLRRLDVSPPQAFARSGRTTQKVAWRLRVQYWDGAAWSLDKRTDWKMRKATPTTAAAFSGRGKQVGSPDLHDFPAYRARIDLRWFGRDGRTIAGRASMSPRHYLGREDPLPDHLQEDDCGATTG